MNADELYNVMKQALMFFGLSFHDKERMMVSILGII